MKWSENTRKLTDINGVGFWLSGGVMPDTKKKRRPGPVRNGLPRIRMTVAMAVEENHV
ncbi:MAG: hypothetical protein ACN2B6_00130 [Rickettsiales bacterium]